MVKKEDDMYIHSCYMGVFSNCSSAHQVNRNHEEYGDFAITEKSGLYSLGKLNNNN